MYCKGQGHSFCSAHNAGCWHDISAGRVAQGTAKGSNLMNLSSDVVCQSPCCTFELAPLAPLAMKQTRSWLALHHPVPKEKGLKASNLERP